MKSGRGFARPTLLIAERVIFRSLFPTGMTVFDPLDDELLGGLSSMSHLSARQEYKSLVDALNLPISEKAERRKLGTRPDEAKAREAFTLMAPVE